MHGTTTNPTDPPGPDRTEEYLAYADRVWRGEEDLTAHLEGRFSGDRLVRVGDGVGMYPGFANSVVFDTGSGLVMVDSGDAISAAPRHAAVRAFSPEPVRAVVFTHGHVDHVGGTGPFDEEEVPPEVIGHEAVAARFDRYRDTAGYNAWVNRRQFGVPWLEWPTEYRRPDTTYRDRHTLLQGSLTFELVHARGETDDHTYVWVPELGVLCTGDLFIWNSPNAGNPQKVQRYPQEWARALRDMAALDAEVLLPGHGVPITGADRVRQALLDTARLLESLCEQTRTLMNEGARLDTVVQRVQVPADLLAKPYLRPAYDEPEFVVRNLWRLWGGWYDLNPAHLKPAPEAEVAAELCAAAGGANVLARRALSLFAEGRLRLACHLAETAALAAPDDVAVALVRARVYGGRAESESSTMARGVFSWAAAESAAVVEGTDVSTELARTKAGARHAAGLIGVGLSDPGGTSAEAAGAPEGTDCSEVDSGAGVGVGAGAGAEVVQEAAAGPRG
ncbi:alkyl sulfatase dimerization domain-containing protein [Streptomyces erythrochromogenes]|uniref:alkyl sulfatase dimerization domain-containing protein n=1 Tax=Streptomyces erythrochromogenes TaxID=285574 RepID=UPI0036C1EE36